MKLNKKKTNITCNEVVRSRLRTGVIIDGEQLEDVAEHKYLGRLVTSGNGISKEIGQRITSGWRRFEEYSQLFESTFTDMIRGKQLRYELQYVPEHGLQSPKSRTAANLSCQLMTIVTSICFQCHGTPVLPG